MKHILILMMTATLLISCNSETKKDNATGKTVQTIEIENVTASAPDLVDETVKFSGLVTHVCKHGGQKMFLTDTAQKVTLLVRVGQSIPEFDIALEGSEVEITGKVVASVDEVEEGKGENHEEGEDCAAEARMEEETQGVEGSTSITYYVEAASFKEIEN